MRIGALAPLLAACVLTIGCAAAWAGAPATEGQPPEDVTWSELRFAARKLGISASIDIRLDPAGGEAGAVARPPERRAGGTFVLESTTHLPGRTFVAREILEPPFAAAREIVDTETGAKHHRKTYTLSRRGFLLEMLEPDSLAQTLLPPERWTRVTRSFTSYPEGLPEAAVITSPAGLLWVASRARLRSPGDLVVVYVLVQTQVERVTAYVAGVEEVPLDFEEQAGDRLSAFRGQATVVKLVVHGEPVGPASPSVFRLFGLEGDVVILWDPVRRLPVELEGQVKMLGQVGVRLAGVTLR